MIEVYYKAIKVAIITTGKSRVLELGKTRKK